MSKITFDMNTSSATAAIFALRAAEIAEFWNGDTITGTINDAYDVLNPLLSAQSLPPLLCGDEFGTAVQKLNALNDIYATLGAAVGPNNAFVIEPDSVFTDTAGETPAQFGQPVAAIRTVGGDLFATQSSAPARPTYGRHPEVGRRNMLPNNTPSGAALGVLGSGGALPTGWEWPATTGLTREVVALGIEDGRPYIDIRATTEGANANTACNLAIIPIPVADGQTWTSSIYARIVGGSTDNLTFMHRVFISSDTSASYQATQAVDLNTSSREVLTHTMDATRIASGVINGALPRIAFTNITGPLDITIRISGAQFEQASAASDVQITGANGFDVTEAGQRSVYYLQPDGVDDNMALVTSFASTGAHALASAFDHTLGVDNFPLGSVSGASRFGIDASNPADLEIWSDTDSNQTVFSGAVDASGRLVAVANVPTSGAAAQGWINGTQLPTGTLTGAMHPVGGYDRLFRAGGSYSAGRFYGGALIPAAITETQRRIIDRALAYAAGVSL